MTTDPTLVPASRSQVWKNHGVLETVYSNWWVTMTVDDVERPDGSRVRHEVIRGPSAAGVVCLDPDRGVLMIWRHRFMPDSWGWEIPGGGIDPGESPVTAAQRECVEETGWEPVGELELITRHHPSAGFVDQTFYVFLATGARHLGDPSDANEAALVAWRGFDDIAADLRSGAISDAFTQVGLAFALMRSGFAERFASLQVDPGLAQPRNRAFPEQPR